jgi:hypothetical protein
MRTAISFSTTASCDSVPKRARSLAMGCSAFGRRFRGPGRDAWSIAAALALMGLAASCGSPGGGRAQVIEAAPGGSLGDLALISKGSVAPGLLTDGTPVWEIRHADGSVSVLGAGVLPTPEAVERTQGIPGLEVVATWLKPDRHFDAGAIYNEYGTALGYGPPNVGGHPALPTTARDMTTYESRIVNGQVVIGQPHLGEIRHFDPAHPVAGQNSYTMDQILTFNPPGRPLVPVRAISQAQAEAPGTMSLVDADIIIVNGGAARICSGGHRADHVPFPPCPTTSSALPFVSYPAGQGYVWAVTGPIFLRTGRSTFSEAAVFGGGGGVGAAYSIDGPLPYPRP